MLPPDIFKTVVKNAPLFAIDLVVINEFNELLVGKRLNAPAKDWWFVLGGRVFKNESLAHAFERISKSELGTQYVIESSRLLGIYEHFYEDSMFGGDISTHYVTATHFLSVKMDELNLPTGGQHSNYRWVGLTEVESDASIHHFSKIYMLKLAGKKKMP